MNNAPRRLFLALGAGTCALILLRAGFGFLGHPGLLATGPIREEDLSAFQAAVRGGAARVVDARPAYFFDRGHVPGAFNLPADEARTGPLPFGRDEVIVVYCSDPDCTASLRSARALKERGYRRVERFAGGFSAWESAGLPVEGEPR